ncbi:MAG: phosphate ABC transporter permease PstA [Burkholderiaceae bacterium]|nr:phosphate ABC transporter permease PstA [Burkholderiaceae bacterium]
MSKASSRTEKAAVAISWLSVLLVLLVLGVLLAFLFWRSLPSWSLALFFGDTPPLDAILHDAPVFDGLWPACVGTLAIVALSSMIAVPLGVASGIYLAEYADSRSKATFSFCVDLLAGIPSILVGLFGFALLLLLRKTCAPEANTGLLLSALCLAVLILPYLISTTQLSIAGLPQELRLTGASLGLSHDQIVWRILLPASLPGIFSGIILAIGRAAEDTAVILLTGAVANAGTPSSLTDNYEALPFHIYYLAAEHQSPEELAQAFGAALVLLCLTGLTLCFARWLQARLVQTWKTGGLS